MIRRLKLGEESESKSKFSIEETLALFFQLDFTEERYSILRKKLAEKGYKDLFPPYYRLREKKENCRPAEAVNLEDFSAEGLL